MPQVSVSQQPSLSTSRIRTPCRAMAAGLVGGGRRDEAYQAALNDVYKEILQCAVKNNADGIRQLVRIGCPPSYANGIGQTALHVASLWGCAEAVSTLLECRANVNQQNQLRGATPLHAAAMGRGPADKRALCVKLLLQGRGDVNVLTQDGCSPLDLADSGELQEAFGAVPLLLHKAVTAQKLEDLEAVIQMVKARAVDLELDTPDPDGLTALHLAIIVGWRRGLSTLLAAGAAVHTQALKGDTPLHTAVRRGDLLSLRTLLAAQADVNTRDHDQDRDPRFRSLSFVEDPNEHRTALHWAAFLGNVVAMRSLLDARADPNLRDTQRRTALHLALDARDRGFECGVGVGVHINGTKQEKVNGALGAICGDQRKSADGALERWPVLADGLAGDGFLLKEENLGPLLDEAIQTLLGARADANLARRGEMHSPLHESARKGDAAMVTMLLAGKASVDLQEGKQGFTALHFAARSKQHGVVELLVDAHADLALKSFAGWTAADLAERNSASPGLVALLRGVAVDRSAVAVEALRPQRLDGLSAAERAALFID